MIEDRLLLHIDDAAADRTSWNQAQFLTFFTFYDPSCEEDGHQPEGPELADEQVDEAMSWQDKGEQVRKKPHLD